MIARRTETPPPLRRTSVTDFQHSVPINAREGPVSPRRSTILIADDDRMTRQLLRCLLENHGYTVVEAATFKELPILASRVRPSALLLDMVMSSENGPRLLQELKAHETFQNVPILVCSAESSREKVLSILLAGASDYVLKPFNRGRLLDRLQQAIRVSMCGVD